MKHPFACVLINGCLAVRCPIPPENGQMSKDFELDDMDPPQEVVRGGDRCFTFNFRYSSPNLVPRSNMEWHGMLILEDGMHIDLGCIETRCQSTYAEITLPYKPLKATMFISEVPQNPRAGKVAADEELLLEHVKNMMEDDKVNPRHGSLPLSLVQSLAMRSEYYAEVMKRYDGFLGFVQSLKQDFTTFNYSRDEIQGRDMQDYVCPGECRVVLRTGRRVHFVSEGEEDALVDFLKELLKDSDCTSEYILLKIHEAGLGFSISPSFSQLMRFLTRNKNLFSWSTDPSQVTMVTLNQGGVVPPAKGKTTAKGSKGHVASNTHNSNKRVPTAHNHNHQGHGKGKARRVEEHQSPQVPLPPQMHNGNPQMMATGPCIYPVSR